MRLDFSKYWLNKALATNITSVIILIFSAGTVLQKSVFISFHTVLGKKGYYIFIEVLFCVALSIDQWL